MTALTNHFNLCNPPVQVLCRNTVLALRTVHWEDEANTRQAIGNMVATCVQAEDNGCYTSVWAGNAFPLISDDYFDQLVKYQQEEPVFRGIKLHVQSADKIASEVECKFKNFMAEHPLAQHYRPAFRALEEQTMSHAAAIMAAHPGLPLRVTINRIVAKPFKCSEPFMAPGPHKDSFPDNFSVMRFLATIAEAPQADQWPLTTCLIDEEEFLHLDKGYTLLATPHRSMTLLTKGHAVPGPVDDPAAWNTAHSEPRPWPDAQEKNRRMVSVYDLVR